jgi:AcrR family transcriptional regulator
LPQAPFDGSGPERERICAALIEAVADRGYQSTSVDDVIERAGVDQDIFSQHFDCLEECFAAAWGGVDAEISDRMSTAYGRRGDWQDRLRDALSAGLEYLASDEDRAKVYVAEALYVSEGMRDRQREALTRLSSTVDLGRDAAGESGGRTPPGIAEAVSGAIWHRVQQLVQTGRGAELPDQVSRFMYIAVLPYRGAMAAEAELGRS